MNWFNRKKREVAKRFFKPGWTVPWMIGENSGKYYWRGSLKTLSEKYGGTRIIFVEQVNSEIIVHIHPDEVSQIEELDKNCLESLEHTQVTLCIDKTMPNREQIALEQSLETIDFVGRYNKDLASYLQDNLIEKMKARRRFAQQ